MPTDTHWSETTTDKTNGRLALATDATVLGTDGERATHYYSRAANRITVIDTADLVRRYDLGDYSLLAWVTYVSAERGWHELDCAERFLDRLATLMCQ